MDFSTSGSFLTSLKSVSEVTSARRKIVFGLFLSLIPSPKSGEGSGESSADELNLALLRSYAVVLGC
jgi:hypothetical protein